MQSQKNNSSSLLIEQKDSLSIKKIVMVSIGSIIAIVLGFYFALNPFALTIRIGAPIGITAGFLIFGWLFVRRNPEAAARRRGGLFLLFSGNLFLSKVFVFRTLEVQIGDFIAILSINSEQHYLVDLAIDISCIIAGLISIGFGVFLLKAIPQTMPLR